MCTDTIQDISGFGINQSEYKSCNQAGDKSLKLITMNNGKKNGTNEHGAEPVKFLKQQIINAHAE